MRICSPDDTVGALVESGLPLAISCRRCHCRTLFGCKQIRSYESHYRTVHRLPLLCRCGSKDLGKYLLDAQEETEEFLESTTDLAVLKLLPPQLG